MKRPFSQALLLATFSIGVAAVSGTPARAVGTATIQQPDGNQKTYANVRIIIWNESLALTSSDGKSTVVIGKASCTKIGELVRCLPWDATLFQNGQKVHIPLQSGTVWLNPSGSMQQLSHSTTQIPPRGVLLAIKTKRGTYVTLEGVVDEVHR
jgi:hypothetical protein